MALAFVVVMLLAAVTAPAGAAKIESVVVQATNPAFVSTGVVLPTGGSAVVTATGDGTCNAQPDSGCPAGGDPNGTVTCQSINYGPGPAGEAIPADALAGRLGNGPAFVIGRGTTVHGPGQLQLVFNDCAGAYYNNGGSYSVKIIVSEPVLAVSVFAPIGAAGADIGQVYDVIVRVKARGGDLKDVRLSKGLTVAGAPYVRRKKHYISCGNAVVVTGSPPEASGFPLSDGQTRSFVFRVRGHRSGPSTLKVHAIGLNDSYKTEKTAEIVVHTDSPPLRRGGDVVEPLGGNFCTAANGHGNT